MEHTEDYVTAKKPKSYYIISITEKKDKLPEASKKVLKKPPKPLNITLSDKCLKLQTK